MLIDGDGGPSAHPAGAGAGVAAHELRGLRHAPRSAFLDRDPQKGVNNVRSDVNRTIWRLFKEHNITIPVAQREVRIHASPEDAEDWAIPGKAQRRE